MKILKMEVQSCREDNERLIRAQEKQNQLNDQPVQSLNQLQKERKNKSSSRHEIEGIPHPSRDSYRRYMHSRSARRDHKHHYSPSPRKAYYSFEGPMNNLKVSLVRHQRRRHEKEELHGELRKIKIPIFYGENKRGEDVESWLLGMRKYFPLYQYFFLTIMNIFILKYKNGWNHDQLHVCLYSNRESKPIFNIY